jgi:ligand-binding SRPBCC domain-containing protein
MSRKIQFEQWVPFEIGRVFVFFANPRNLPRIMPPATATKLLAVNLVLPVPISGDLAVAQQLAGAGSEVVTSFRLFSFLPLHAQWVARITEFEWNHHFADVQRKGPFKSFHHRHQFTSAIRDGIQGTIVRDMIEYEVGYGFIGRLAEGFIAAQLQYTFEYRQQAFEKQLRLA